MVGSEVIVRISFWMLVSLLSRPMFENSLPMLVDELPLSWSLIRSCADELNTGSVFFTVYTPSAPQMARDITNQYHRDAAIQRMSRTFMPVFFSSGLMLSLSCTAVLYSS